MSKRPAPKRSSKKTAKQMTFAIEIRGGRRAGAGRTPVHVTLKLETRLFGTLDRVRGGKIGVAGAAVLHPEKPYSSHRRGG